MVKKIIKSESGVVGIVTAVLLIGLIVAVVSLVQAVYVPKWMEEREAEHMDQVVTQFAQLKSAIDTHVANEQPLISIASPITLGSKELPYLMSLRAYGSLEILSDSFNITIINVSNNSYVPLGTIKYSSMNGYFIDQSFIYENGAFITNQIEGNMISMKPSFVIENVSGENVINFSMVNIIPVGGKTNGGGYGTTSILTEYHNTTPSSTDYNWTYDVTKITINTSYTNAWELFIRGLLDKNKIDYTYSTIGKEVKINFNNTITVKYKIVNINAQIGPGWVE